MMQSWTSQLFAQTTQPAPGAAKGTQSTPGGIPPFFGLLLALVFVWYFIVLRPQKAERKKRESMLDALKKNDRVITIGGIIGIVVNAKDDEVILKVDESSNTKLTLTRSAIQRVLSVATDSNTTNGGKGKQAP